MTSSPSNPDRRQCQRFAALRDGKPCIDISLNGLRLPLIDLSLDGFSLPASAELPEGEFDFVMRLIDGFGDKVSGRARLVNQPGDLQGCQFSTLSESAARTLQEWLTVIVICSASVRLSSQEAEAIVKGPSII
jgi:hypothetical protein